MKEQQEQTGASFNREAAGWLALPLSILAISWSALFVRYADVSPIASAFWRMALAMPVLYLWTRLSVRSAHTTLTRGGWGISIGAGLSFAADLAFFHLAVGYTSVTNASFIANLASIFAVAASALILKERIGVIVWIALGVAMIGAWLMGGAQARLAAFGLGDMMAVGAAVTYGAYFIFLKQAQAHLSSALVMWRSSLVATLALLIAVILEGGAVWPKSAAGWLPLLGLGLLSHALGQGLTAFAIARLSVAPVALAVLSQPVITALLAMLLLDEPISLAQSLGAALILLAVAASRFKAR